VTHGKRAEWTALARRAIQSSDLASARAVIADFLTHGGRTDDALALRRELRRLEAVEGVAAVSKKLVDEVTRRRKDLLSAEAATAWTAFASLPDSSPIAFRADVLRGVLSLDPSRPEALAWLRARLPEGVVPPTVTEPLEWLDVVETTAYAPLRRIGDGSGDEMTADERALSAARVAWREDLVGLRTDQLRLMTPVSSPGRIARCLALGELVCSALDGLFGVEPTEAGALEPLEIHLFESKEEYVEKTPAGQQGGEAGRAWVAWTLGHYRPTDGISSLYVPPGDDAFEQVVPTFVHEITHHWLDRRMPQKPRPRGARGGGNVPGYFLEEGFATLVEEARLDLRAREVSFENSRADSLDSVASSPHLLPWPSVFSLTQAEFQDLSRAHTIQVPQRWVLGRHRMMSEANLFYAQSAAACHWMLRSDGGKRKAVLLDWIRDFHAGATKSSDLETRLGMTAAQAGAAILAWSRAESQRE
jgi:hypothetical protein